MGCSALFAQNSFRITVGGSMPIGKFGDAEAYYSSSETKNLLKWALLDEESKYGGAGMGFTVGLQGKFGFLGIEGLGATVSVDGFFNFLNSDINDYFDDYKHNAFSRDDVTYISITKPKYINVAPMVGLNYQHNISESFGIYAGFGVGANFRKITDYDIKIEGFDTYPAYKAKLYTEVEYDMAVTFAYKIGVGAVIANRVVIGLDFFRLGNAKVKGEGETSYVNNYHNYNGNVLERFRGSKINPMFLTLSVGVQF